MKRIRNTITGAAVICGLTAAALIGCGGTIVSPDVLVVVEVPPEPATEINILVSTTAGLDNIRLRAVGPTPVDTTFSMPAGAMVATITLGNLDQGTYTVSVSRSGYTFAAAVVVLKGADVPNASLVLSKIETTATMEIGSETITDPVITTTIVVEQPSLIQQIAEGVPPAEVAVSGVTGVVTVITQAPTEVPPVISNNQPAQSVLGAVTIQAPATPDAKVQVKLPIPIDASLFADAAGGIVDVLRFNTETLTWEKIGEATIGADGLATANITGLGETTIIAIGKEPVVTTTPSTAELIRTIEPDELEELKAQGETDYTFDPAPTVSLSVGKIARRGPLGKVAQNVGPGAFAWGMIEARVRAALTAANYPGNSINAIINKARKAVGLAAAEEEEGPGFGMSSVKLPPGLAQFSVEKVFFRASYTYTFNNVKMTYNVMIQFTDVVEVVIWHGSGEGGGE